MISRQLQQALREQMPYVLAIAGLILLVPLVAMQFTKEVAWTLSDFLVAGGLLVGTGLAYIAITSRLNCRKCRINVGIALGVALAVVWVQLAVGII
jgi:uncharacterized membrane protein